MTIQYIPYILPNLLPFIVRNATSLGNIRAEHFTGLLSFPFIPTASYDNKNSSCTQSKIKKKADMFFITGALIKRHNTNRMRKRSCSVTIVSYCVLIKS